MDQNQRQPKAKQGGEECGSWYVYVCDRIDNAGINDRYGCLAGPFSSKELADTHFDTAMKKAEELDPRAVFYRFGVCRVMIPGFNKPGTLNNLLGLPTSS